MILNEVQDRIIAVADPRKLILFGSRAAETAEEHSDFDICVVMDGNINRRKVAQRIYLGLVGLNAAVDIIVATPEDLLTLAENPFLMYSMINKQGVTIYERK